MIELELLSGERTHKMIDRLVDIYQAAFSQFPYHETLPDFLNFIGRISYHIHQPGFRCVILRPAPGEPVVGFVYGFPGQAGDWFYDMVIPRLDTILKARYLSDYFEFAEIALLPDWQGQGLGGRLHDTLLASVTQSTACLVTAEAETSAHHLYRRRGWVTLSRGIRLPGSPLSYEIMGIELLV